MKTVVKCSQNKYHSRSESPCYYVRMRRMNNCPIFGSIPIFIPRFCWSWSGARPLGVRIGPKPPRYSKTRWRTLQSCSEIVRLKRLQFFGALPTLVINLNDFNFCRVCFVPPNPAAAVLGLRESRGWPGNTWRIRLLRPFPSIYL